MSFDIRKAMAAAFDAGGDSGALAWGSDWMSWAQLGRVRAALDAMLELGEPVGLVARNRPGCVAALVAQIASGRPTVMIHGAQAAAGIAAEMVRLGLGAVIAEADDWDGEIFGAAAQAGILGIAAGAFGKLPRQVVPGGEARKGAKRNPDFAIEILSSGTTGAPKRVPLGWTTLSSAAADAGGAYAGSGTRAAPQILLHPLGTIGGISYLLPAFAFGQPVVLLERFTVSGWVEAVGRHRPKRASLPAAALSMLLDSETPKAALASLEVVAVGGGKLDVDMQDRFEARFGIPVLIAFGATEFAGVIANWSLDLYRRYGKEKRGSAGRASANVALRIVDPQSGATLPTGEIGLLEAKAARLGEGWVRTTDFAAIDTDGFLFVHGRADGAINRGGFKIVPDMVADALRKHPDVADAAVVGRADGRLGEVPVAAVELRPQAVMTGEALRLWAKERLLAYQVPAEIRVLERLPRNGSMKVALAEVAALFR